MNYKEKDKSDWIRFSWNYFPNSHEEQSDIVVPLGCLYTPLKEIEGIKSLKHIPEYWRQCWVILNPNCFVDLELKIWKWPFWWTENYFSDNISSLITEENLPGEVDINNTTVEYSLPWSSEKPVYLFVIDTCIDKSELDEIKDSIQQCLTLLPEDALVGLITYGKHVFIYELGWQGFPKAFAFKGDKQLSLYEMCIALKIFNNQNPNPNESIRDFKAFMTPLSEWEFNLNNIIEDLHPDPFPITSEQRYLRWTGNALNIAIGLIEWITDFRRSRIIAMIGGICTYGPGKVVDEKHSFTIRSHQDIIKQNEKTKYMKEAIKFYETLSSRAVKKGIVIDIFASSLDQAGVLEMKSLFEATGGY